MKGAKPEFGADSRTLLVLSADPPLKGEPGKEQYTARDRRSGGKKRSEVRHTVPGIQRIRLGRRDEDQDLLKHHKHRQDQTAQREGGSHIQNRAVDPDRNKAVKHVRRAVSAAGSHFPRLRLSARRVRPGGRFRIRAWARRVGTGRGLGAGTHAEPRRLPVVEASGPICAREPLAPSRTGRLDQAHLIAGRNNTAWHSGSAISCSTRLQTSWRTSGCR